MNMHIFHSQLLLAIVVAGAVARPAAAEAPPPPDGSPKNGLSAEALDKNTLIANKGVLEILQTHPLNDAVFGLENGYIRHELENPYSRAVLRELVKCALNAGTKLHDENASPALKESRENVYQGELGLCQNAPEEVGDWTTNSPTLACQQLVTACILARVNGMKRSIPISLRGEPTKLFPIRTQVLTEQRLREPPPQSGQDPIEGQPIASFSHSAICPPGGCDWIPAHVGICTTGTIQIADADESSCTNTSLRACAGLHGCTAAHSSTSTLQYTRPLNSQEHACRNSPLTFECPQGAATGGYYAIMARWNSGSAWTRQPSLSIRKLSGSGAYPATEPRVFGFTEGAFYGNLLDPEALRESWYIGKTGGEICRDALTCCDLNRNSRCHERSPLPYKKMFACYSFEQEQDSQNDALGAAYLNSRICDQPDPEHQCFPHKPTRCYYRNPRINEAQGAHCKWNAQAGIFEGCQAPASAQAPGTPPETYRPITVHLNEPCDLTDNETICALLRRTQILQLPRTLAR